MVLTGGCGGGGGCVCRELEKAVEHFPADMLLALTLAQLLASDKRPHAAAAALRHAAATAGEQADAHTLLALWHESVGVPEEAAAKTAHFALLSQCYLTAVRARRLCYCDEKVANREIRVWHFVIENGY
jgi:predicted Zn-dependent protease